VGDAEGASVGGPVVGDVVAVGGPVVGCVVDVGGAVVGGGVVGLAVGWREFL
jgi:hypothetical protein